MIIANRLSLESWKPESTLWKDRSPPQWTRLRSGDLILSNSIEFADWKVDPVVPMVCSECWETGCGAGGLAHLVRTDSQLLWMQPYVLQPSRYNVQVADLDFRSISDTVMIDRIIWEVVQRKSRELPEFNQIPRITLRDLHHLWKQQLPACVPTGSSSSQRKEFYRTCLAGHPMEGPEAIDLVLEMLQAPELPEEQVHGNFIPVDPNWSDLQSFYFDGDDVSEWRAFTSYAPHKLIIANQWLLRSEQDPV